MLALLTWLFSLMKANSAVAALPVFIPPVLLSVVRALSTAASANALETHSIGVELDAYASRDPHSREQGERPHRWSRVEAPSSERQSVADDAPGGDNTERDSAIVSLSPRNVLPGTITEHEDEPAIDEDSTYAWQRTI